MSTSTTNQNLTVSVQAREFGTDSYINVQLTPPEEGESDESLFIAMLDVSISMDEPATKDATEAQGFTRLDLVKHSMNTITHLLTEKQQLCIITFSTTAQIELPPTVMDDNGRKSALATIRGLETRGSTNIWAALQLGLDTAARFQNKDVSLLLLTDGEPNINPPEGIVPALNRALRQQWAITDSNQFGRPYFSISAFGFGYELDSRLLDNIARHGHGCYGYIPDCSMVGTVFINYMSNALSKAYRNVTLQIETEDKSLSHTSYLDAVQFGQTRNILLRVLKFEGTVKVRLSHRALGTPVEYEVPIEARGDDAATISDQYAKHLVISLLEEQLRLPPQSVNLAEWTRMLKERKAEIQRLADSVTMTPFMTSLLTDIESDSENEGQLLKAVSSDEWYKRWGLNFLLAFIRAHHLEQSTNFKDKSLQLYGGKLFKELQLKANKVFCSLPPPPQTLSAYYTQTSTTRGGYVGASVAPAPVPKVRNMRRYMDASGGCFDGDGRVQLADGTSKKIRELKRGDRVLGGGKSVVTIECIVETKAAANGTGFVLHQIEGVKLTSWHPIKYNNMWLFPNQIAKPITLEKTAAATTVDSVFNIVLTESSPSRSVLINGLEVITLGHGLSEGILEHAYFGTRKSIDDLKQKHAGGWSAGHIVLTEPAAATVRRDERGLIAAYF